MAKFLKSLSKGLGGIFGIRLLDPIEIYFDKESNTCYPIVSKAGCSSIKVKLIRKYKSDFESKFPDIHQVDPSKETSERIIRKFFKSSLNYARFVKSKNLCVIMRDPYKRFYSCYLDVVKGKNVMYKDPSGLDHWIKFSSKLTLIDFLRAVGNIPDYLSDRHFRSQSFYLQTLAKKNAASYQVWKLEDFLTVSDQPDHTQSETVEIKINRNRKSLSEDDLQQLRASRLFQRRYAKDLYEYAQIEQ